MAIYLDANVLHSMRSFTEPKALALGIVAQQLSQQLVVPSTAAHEAEEHFRRSLEAAVEAVERAHRAVQRQFEADFDLLLEPWPDADERVATWRRRLEEFATVVPLADEDAHAALESEITGTRPAQPREPNKAGRGARDAAIWLTVLRHHARLGEEGSFLAKDPKAFSDGNGELHGELAESLADLPAMRLYEEIDVFIERLGTPIEAVAIGLEELNAVAGSDLAVELRTSEEATRAVWRVVDPGIRYEQLGISLEPVEILSQRRYEKGEDAIVLVDSCWTGTADYVFQERDTENQQLWSAIQQVGIEVTAQLFIEEHAGTPVASQFLGAQVESQTSITVREDGTVFSVRTID